MTRDLDMKSLDDAVVIALGSNVKSRWPDIPTLLDAALARFRPEGLDVVARSGWWRSQAWPDPSDPPFVNGVVLVETELDPHGVMAALHRIEEAFGRERHVANAPRTLDLDLVAFGRLVDHDSGVVVPHPRAVERRFVMGPLAEIAPGWTCPEHGETAAVLADKAPVGRDATPMH